MNPTEQIDLAGVPNESIVSNNSLRGEGNGSQNINPFGLFFESQFNEFHDLYVDVVSPPFQAFDDEEIRKILGPVIEPKEKVFPVAPFEILRKHGRKRLMSNGQESSSAGSQTESSFGRGQMLSTERIIELGAEKFISLSSGELNYPYHSSLLGHSENVSKDVQLVQNLLSCAEKVGEKKYEGAIKNLHECKKMSSCTGTPIQRLVFYFTEALHEKIDREATRGKLQGMGKMMTPFPDPVEALTCLDSCIISFHEKHPLSQMMMFSGIQAVLDHLGDASKVHVIDLEIRRGIHCIILMQALASRHENPVSHLKITALRLKSNGQLQETGRQLMDFAESLNFNLSYDIVTVEDLLDLEASHFELSDDEAVAVYSAYTLTHMIGQPDRLEHLMEVIKKINPRAMIVLEIEVNVNSPTFVGRFVEALFFYGAFFESLADCMKTDEMSRRKMESLYSRTTIRNIVAAEGSERKLRHVSINVWRAFFARFGLVQTELSMSSVLQADLVRRRFPSGSSCTLGVNGKCLTVGWKGTPLSSVSVWKFG